MSFETAHAFVAKWEGGFVDDPHDRGGVTKWGISLRMLIGRALDLNGDGVVNRRDIRDMTPEQAREIYKRDYWIASACPRLPPALALPMYDCAVNQGVRRASRILQASVGAKADGIIGPRTLAAVDRKWRASPTGLLSEYCARRARHYSSLSQIVRYGLRWFRRLVPAHGAALTIHLSEGATLWTPPLPFSPTASGPR